MAPSRPAPLWVPHLLHDSMKVHMSAAAVAQIRHEISGRTDELETGGILLGGTDPLRVSVAAGPGPGAVRTRSFFLRDLQFSQELAANEETISGATWVGEWHTHPTGPVHPSSTDLQTYARIQNGPDSLLAQGVLSLIAVPHDVGWYMTAWWCVDGQGTQILMEET